MTRRRRIRLSPFLALAAALWPSPPPAQGTGSPVGFVHRQIDTRRTESVAALDGDGDADVAFSGKKGGPHPFENKLDPVARSLPPLPDPFPGRPGWKISAGGYPVRRQGRAWHDPRGRAEALPSPR